MYDDDRVSINCIWDLLRRLKATIYDTIVVIIEKTESSLDACLSVEKRCCKSAACKAQNSFLGCSANYSEWNGSNITILSVGAAPRHDRQSPSLSCPYNPLSSCSLMSVNCATETFLHRFDDSVSTFRCMPFIGTYWQNRSATWNNQLHNSHLSHGLVRPAL